MNVGMELVFNNVNMTFEMWLLLIVNLGALIIMAKDFKIAAMLEFVANGLLFILFHELGLNYAPAIVSTFTWLVIMALTLLYVDRTAKQGAFI